MVDLNLIPRSLERTKSIGSFAKSAGEVIRRGQLLRENRFGRSAKRKVVCVETGAVYKGISAAGRAIGRSAASVSHALKAGTCSGGYHWQYLDE